MIKMRKNRQKKRMSRKSIIWLCVALLVIALASGALLWKRHSDKTASDASAQQVAYEGPTEEEQQSGDKQKEELANEGEPTHFAPGVPERQATEVFISDANQYEDEVEVRAYMPRAFENGSCEIVLKKGASEIKKTLPAVADGSYTMCAALNVPRSDFAAAGTWNATVTYTSEHYQGSANRNFEVR